MQARGTGRGRRLGLTREKVTAAAVEMIDRDGPEVFSLRRLAAELGIEAMSLYNHVPSKDALLDDVAEWLLGEVDFSGADTGTWQQRLRAHAAAFRSAALRHPKAFQLVLTRPTQSPAALANIRCALASVCELDLDPQELVRVVRSFAAFIVGTIMRELGAATAAGALGPEDARDRLGEIAATGDPLLVSVAPHLAVSDHRAEYQYGIELLIAGLAARVGVPYDAAPCDTVLYDGGAAQAAAHPAVGLDIDG
jgi:AcrR family transcriptional regulator